MGENECGSDDVADSAGAGGTDEESWGLCRVGDHQPGKVGGRIWTGTADAAGRIPARVPRPRLLNVWEWVDDDAAYRAELTCYVASRVCSATPTLRENLDLPGSW